MSLERRSLLHLLDTNRPMSLIDLIKTGLAKGERHITSFQCLKIRVGNWVSSVETFVHFSPVGILFTVSSIVTGKLADIAIPLGSINSMYQNLKGNTYFILLLDEGSVTALIREKLEFNTDEAKKNKYCYEPNFQKQELGKRFITFKLVENDIRHRVKLILNNFYTGKVINTTGHISQDALYYRVMGSNNSSPIKTYDIDISDSDDEPQYLYEQKCVPEPKTIPKTVDKSTEIDLEDIAVIPATPPTPPISTIKINLMPSSPERIIPITIEGSQKEGSHNDGGEFSQKYLKNPLQAIKGPIELVSKPNRFNSEIEVIDIDEDRENTAETEINTVLPTPPIPPLFSIENPRVRIIPIVVENEFESIDDNKKSDPIENKSKTVSECPEEKEVFELEPCSSTLNKPAKVKVIEIDDSAESQPSPKISKTLFVYPREDQDNSSEIVISVDDVENLRPTQWINDNIIDFFCRYIYLETWNYDYQRRSHLFSSFFYEAIYHAVKKVSKEDGVNPSIAFSDLISRWTRNVNIFEKDFIFVPVNYCAHWVLAVICFPGLVAKPETKGKRTSNKRKNVTEVKRRRLVENYDEGEISSTSESEVEEIEQNPCILILDSLRDTEDLTRSRIFNILRTFLQNEWNLKNESAAAFTEDTMPGYFLNVPQQSNCSDCGLYVLKFFEMFFLQPIKSYKNPLPDKSNWFSSAEAESLRSNFYQAILKYVKKHCPDKLHLVPRIYFQDSPNP